MTSLMDIQTETRPEVELLLQQAHLARMRYDLDSARDSLQKAIALDKKNAEAWKLLYELDGIPAATEEAVAQEVEPDPKVASTSKLARRRRVLFTLGTVALMGIGVLLTFVPFHEHGESLLAPVSLHDRMHLNWPLDILLGSAIGFCIMSAIYLWLNPAVDDWG